MDIKDFIELQVNLSGGATDVDQAVRASCIALLAEIEKEANDRKKVDLNLEPGFNITAEYRLGELRGYNQALEEIKALLRPSEPKGEETKPFQSKERLECKRCGLQKSTILTTGKLCISPSITNIPPHDFAEESEASNW